MTLLPALAFLNELVHSKIVYTLCIQCRAMGSMGGCQALRLGILWTELSSTYQTHPQLWKRSLKTANQTTLLVSSGLATLGCVHIKAKFIHFPFRVAFRILRSACVPPPPRQFCGGMLTRSWSLIFPAELGNNGQRITFLVSSVIPRAAWRNGILGTEQKQHDLEIGVGCCCVVRPSLSIKRDVRQHEIFHGSFFL